MSGLIPAGSSPFDSIRRVREDGSEYWSARDLAPLLGYDRWENCWAVVTRAAFAAWNTDGEAASFVHFRDATKMLPIGNGASREGVDKHLTRYACYLVAMNGDPRKPEIAAAQSYFAVMTRRAEVVAPALRLPQSYAEALRELASTVEERDAAQAQVIELRPKADSWDVLADTGADYSAREAAYILNRDPAIDTGQNRLLRILRNWRLIDSHDKPYATHSAHVTLRPQFRTDSSSGERVPARPQVRITVAGLSYLHKRLGGVEPLDFSEVAS